MKRKLFMVLALVLIVPGLLMTTACSKKAVKSTDTGAGSGLTQQGGGKGPVGGGKPGTDGSSGLDGRGTTAMDSATSRFVNEDVHFAYDSSALDAEAQAVLKSKAEFMRSTSGTVTIEGHCDERGTSEYNMALGERRAQSAKKFLMNLGIAGSRMNTVSYGKERPLDPGHDESAWAKNRRAHFELK